MTVPVTAAMMPTSAPPATMTIRSCRRVAPMAASMPSWRWRRAAITADAAAAARATRTICGGLDARRLPQQLAREVVPEGSERGRSGIQQDRYPLGRASSRRRHQRELVFQVAGILNDAGHPLVVSGQGQHGADVDLKSLR